MAGGGQVRAIRDRIRSVGSTAKVTRAMELVAASKMRRAQDNALRARPYAEQMIAVLSRIAAGAGEGAQDAHPLLENREVKSVLYVHITADRGLAGGLNGNMNRAGASLLLEYQPDVERVAVLPVGRKGRDFFRRSGMEIVADFSELGDFPNFEDIRPISRIIMDDFLSGKVDKVIIGYQRFVNAAIQRPTTVQILPIEPPAAAEGADPAASVEFIIEPSPAALLDTLLPRFVEMQVYAAILEARASEQSARMVAMRQATDAANEMANDLTLAYNKARQESITAELLDLVGGVAALESAS
jgi:F-type H+-transporting ATPase subunit gamma